MREGKMNNRGSVTVETTLVLPLFLFAMLCLYHMHQSYLCACTVYEACAEAAEYTAEYGYIGEVTGIVPKFKFGSYVDDKARVERYVEGGVSGVSFWLTRKDDEDYVILEADYVLKVSVPFLPTLRVKKHVCIRQRAYTGDETKEDGNEKEDAETYCYITDNREVYHMSRDCTHLRLSAQPCASEAVCRNRGYTPCEYCGAEPGDFYIITDEGERFHKSLGCLGLKRTVYRVKLSEVGDLPPCGRCGLGGE